MRRRDREAGQRGGMERRDGEAGKGAMIQGAWGRPPVGEELS